jgi:competence protein ComEC
MGLGAMFLLKWRLENFRPSINGLRQKAINLRAYLINQYKKVGLSDDELGLISALALGSKDELGEKVKKSFQTVGASHILSVSGMHVGIIYVALEFMLNFFFRNRKHLFKFLIIAFFLWFYAFLTGLSPSVLRATVMFSFVLFGKILNKPLNIYNSLAASAFFLLLFNPYLIFNVGFQLSYLAVAGIVFLYPKIYNW